MTSERIVPVIFIVEDEALVRLSAVGMLEDAGFRMIEAVNSDEALELLAADSDVQLLFTDVNTQRPSALLRAAASPMATFAQNNPAAAPELANQPSNCGPSPLKSISPPPPLRPGRARARSNGCAAAVHAV